MMHEQMRSADALVLCAHTIGIQSETTTDSDLPHFYTVEMSSIKILSNCARPPLGDLVYETRQ